MDVEDVGFAVVRFSPSIFREGWICDLSNVGRRLPQCFCPSKLAKESVTILPLPIPSEDQDPSFGLATRIFSATWAPGMPTEIIAVFMAEPTEGLPHLVSYNLQMSNSQHSHPLRLVKWNGQPSHSVPWNNNSLTHSARMFELTETLCCFNVLSSAPSPCFCDSEESSPSECPVHKDGEEQGAMIELPLRPDVLPEFDPNELLRFSIEPWSGNMVVLTSQMLYVVSFNRKDSPF